MNHFILKVVHMSGLSNIYPYIKSNSAISRKVLHATKQSVQFCNQG